MILNSNVFGIQPNFLAAENHHIFVTLSVADAEIRTRVQTARGLNTILKIATKRVMQIQDSFSEA